MEVKIDSNNEGLPVDPWFDRDSFRDEFCRAIGLPETIPVATTLEHLLGGLIANTPDHEERINFFLAYVLAQKPSSMIEAQLIVQTLAAHRLSTKMLAKAEKASNEEVAEKWVNAAVKLFRSFKTGFETIAKLQQNKK